MNRHILLLFVMFQMFWFQNVKAIESQYITAADLSYKCLGNHKYQATLIVYVECGSDRDLHSHPQFNAFLSSEKLGHTGKTGKISFILNQVKATDYQQPNNELNLYCSGTVTNCGDQNIRGIRQYKYTGDFDLSQYGESDDWVLYWNDKYRSNFIDNIDTQKEIYLVQTTINNENGLCNTSPQYSLDAPPIFSVLTNEPMIYDLGITDPDGDELRYSIVNPKAIDFNEVIYTGGNSPSSPFSDNGKVTISNKGEISLNTSSKDQNAFFDIQIEEWRNGKKIATTTRGIQITSFQAENKAPHILAPFTKTYCAGTNIEYEDNEFKVVDPNNNKVKPSSFIVQGSTNTVYYLKQVDNFDTKNDTTTFAIRSRSTLTNNDVGESKVIIVMEDDFCPTPAKTNETFTFNIVASPVIDLIDHRVLPCHPKDTLIESIEGNDGNLSFNWSTWEIHEDKNGNDSLVYTLESTENNIHRTTSDPGNYALFVTNDNECKSNIDTVSLLSSYEGYQGLIENVCWVPLKDDSIFITDYKTRSTFSSKVNLKIPDDEITSSTWLLRSLGDDSQLNGEYTLPDMESKLNIQFPDTGRFYFENTFLSKENCSSDLKGVFDVCIPKEPKFKKSETDSLCINQAIFVDTTHLHNYCQLNKRTWYVNDTLIVDELGQAVNDSIIDINIYNLNIGKDKGYYDVKLKYDYQSGCDYSTTIRHYFYAKPKVEIYIGDSLMSDTLLHNCSAKDILMKAVITGDDNGEAINYWDANDSLIIKLDNGIQVSLDSLHSDSVGLYKVIATDKFQCSDTAQLHVVYPLKTNFYYEQVCKEGDIVHFIDSTKTKSNKIINWTWYFGDGDSLSTSDSFLSIDHKYPYSDNFTAVLKVTDSLNCTLNDTVIVYNTFLKDIFHIDPSEIVRARCAKDSIKGFNVEVLGPNNNINSIVWNWGVDSLSIHTFEDSLAIEGIHDAYIYEKDSTYPISSTVIYNQHPKLGNEGCTYQFDTTLYIKPAFKGEIIDLRNCYQDTSLFEFRRDTNARLTNVLDYRWIIAENNTFSLDDDLLNPKYNKDKVITELTGDKATYKFSEEGSWQIYMWAKDSNLCQFGLVDTKEIHSAEEISHATWGKVCAGDELHTELFPKEDIVISNYYGYSSEVIGYWENRVDAQDLTYEYVIPTLPDGQDIPIEFFMMNKYIVRNQFSTDTVKCSFPIYDTIRVVPIPDPDFAWDTVCAIDQFVSFTDLSTAVNDHEITSWSWNFGDDSSSTIQNPTHTYNKGGSYDVILTVDTDECPNSDTLTVQVNHKPETNFYWDIKYPEAYTPIPFVDSTIVSDNIAYQKYEFGDGTVIETKGDFQNIIEHTYDEVNVNAITYYVATEFGCKDTVSKVADLNVYLTLPTAFSPNGDGNNDYLSLIHKSIEELYVYKIFNRWGEVVFDANGDLNKVWDGSYKGRQQEAGTYLVHIEALGAYDQSFNLKQHVTIIR